MQLVDIHEPTWRQLSVTEAFCVTVAVVKDNKIVCKQTFSQLHYLSGRVWSITCIFMYYIHIFFPRYYIRFSEYFSQEKTVFHWYCFYGNSVGLALAFSLYTVIHWKITKNKNYRLKNPTGRRPPSWIFTSVAEELISGLPRNNKHLMTGPKENG